MTRRRSLAVGCAGFPVNHAEYASELDFVEVQDTFEEPPDPAQLPAEFREDLTRSLVAWQVITHPRKAHRGMRTEIPTHAAVGHFTRSRWTDEAWQRMDALARAVGADAIVLRTPPSFTPTADHIQCLENFVANAGRPGQQLVWDWAPPWPAAQAFAVCERLDLLPAVDPTAGPIPDDEIVYLRVNRKRGPMPESAMARVADETRGRTGFVVFSGPAAWEDARRFKKML